ncbi:hypothetical protein [Enterococcus phage vB_Efs19_KEN17]
MECLSEWPRKACRNSCLLAVGTPYRGFSGKYKSEAYNVGFPKTCQRLTVARPARPRKSYPLPFPKTPARRGHACAPAPSLTLREALRVLRDALTSHRPTRSHKRLDLDSVSLLLTLH